MIRPSDLPPTRDEFKQYMGQWGTQFLTGLESHTGTAGMISLKDPIIAALGAADLYCVSADMASLAIEAGKTLGANYAIAPEDVPSQQGLALFAEPFFMYRAAGGVHPLVGALWFYIDDRVMVVWLSDRFDHRFLSRSRDGTKITERQVKARGACRLLISGFQAMTYDAVNRPMLNINEWSAPDSNGDELLGQFAVLKSVWLLMGQQLAVVEREKVGRPTRSTSGRMAKRPEVRVICLRRASHRSDAGPAHDWQHRWMVRGHWRMQPWGPKRERVRPVWIAPHVKGPEGKPLLGGEKVYHLAR